MNSSLGDGIKNLFLAGVGAVALTAEKGKDLIDELVKKGELTVEQGKVLNEELKHTIKEKVKENVTVVHETAPGDILDQVDTLSKEEIEALKAKLAAMDAAAEDAHEADADGE